MEDAKKAAKKVFVPDLEELRQKEKRKNAVITDHKNIKAATLHQYKLKGFKKRPKNLTSELKKEFKAGS